MDTAAENFVSVNLKNSDTIYKHNLQQIADLDSLGADRDLAIDLQGKSDRLLFRRSQGL
jgi:hypothetical protein